ncbi:hypothetical protein QJQ45_010687 [Haematococcus lacustris]|nr:hypothetical protein QJQ45_010687 [Haematococcus lacustris]
MKKSSGGGVNKGQTLPGLQSLPAELLDAVLRQLDASSRLQVFRTSKLLATALLQKSPSIQLTYPTQHHIIGQHLRELAPFLLEMLQNRQQAKLHLSLRTAFQLTEAIQQRRRAEPTAAASEATRLVAWMLGAVPLCGAVDCLTINWREDIELPWEPVCSAILAASFPSLTSLTVRMNRISIGHLANAINHPQLLSRLLHLDIMGAEIIHDGQLTRSPFIGSRLQTLSLSGRVTQDGEHKFLYGLWPLPRTLTQLQVSGWHSHRWNWDRLASAVSCSPQLQQLKLYDEDRYCRTRGPGLTALLQAVVTLPSLHTLVMISIVVGQEQLDALLALTQITHLEVHGFSGLTSSRASADCSWRQLKIWRLDWVSAAYLPLHSLTHPLRLHELVKGIEEPSIEVLAAAELNLCERNKAGLALYDDLCLSKATVDLLTEQYLSHSHTAHQPPHPTVASSSSHSGPSTSTSLASSSSPEGHITPGGPGGNIGQGVRQGGSTAGGQALMQRLGCCVKVLRITEQGLGEARLSPANQEALAALFPNAELIGE